MNKYQCGLFGFVVGMLVAFLMAWLGGYEPKQEVTPNPIVQLDSAPQSMTQVENVPGGYNLNTGLVVYRGNNTLNIFAEEPNWQVTVTLLSPSPFNVQTSLETMENGYSYCTNGYKATGRVDNSDLENCPEGLWVFEQVWTDEIYKAGGQDLIEGSDPISIFVAGTPNKIWVNLGTNYENPNWANLWNNCGTLLYDDGESPEFLGLLENACPENKH